MENKNDVKAVLAVITGVSAFILSVVSAADIGSEVRKKGRGNRAVYISGKSAYPRRITSSAASVLLALTGLFAALLYFDGKEQT